MLLFFSSCTAHFAIQNGASFAFHSRSLQLCDFNNDGLLDDNELNKFQMFVFGLPLTLTATSVSACHRRITTRHIHP